MTYHDQLHPWCVIRHLPKMQRLTVARFRRRNEAEAHLRALQLLTPQYHYTIIFDPTLPDIPIRHTTFRLFDWIE